MPPGTGLNKWIWKQSNNVVINNKLEELEFKQFVDSNDLYMSSESMGEKSNPEGIFNPNYYLYGDTSTISITTTSQGKVSQKRSSVKSSTGGNSLYYNLHKERYHRVVLEKRALKEGKRKKVMKR